MKKIDYYKLERHMEFNGNIIESWMECLNYNHQFIIKHSTNENTTVVFHDIPRPLNDSIHSLFTFLNYNSLVFNHLLKFPKSNMGLDIIAGYFINTPLNINYSLYPSIKIPLLQFLITEKLQHDK